MKELIARLRTDPIFDDSTLGNETADLLELLTSGDVKPPFSFKMLSQLQSGTIDVVRADAVQDYGDRRDAAGYLRGVLAERERIAKFCETQKFMTLMPEDSAANLRMQGMHYCAKELANLIRKGTP